MSTGSHLMEHSCVNQTASCEGWSWKLSARKLFKAVQVHCQRLPSKIDARVALKDWSLVQSLGTEIEVHLWQSNDDTTHHRRNIRRDTRWKTQGTHSISPTYWISALSTVVEEQSPLNRKPRTKLFFIHGAAVHFRVDLIYIGGCLMCWIAQHPSGSKTNKQK